MVDEGEISLGKETAKQLGLLRLGLNVNSINQVSIFPKIKGVVVGLIVDPKVEPIQQPLR